MTTGETTDNNSLNGLSVVIPSFNEDHLTLDFISKELNKLGAEVIIVDDGSEKPYPGSIKHNKNMGYGESIITGIINSTSNDIMTIDGDGQHLPSEVVRLYKAWKLIPYADLLIGTRRIGEEAFNRVFARKFINIIASIIANKWFCDLNSGIRIFRKNTILGYISILCKKFSFTTSLTMSYYLDGLKIEWFPIILDERKAGSSNVRMRDVFTTFYYIIKIGFALRTRGIRNWIRNIGYE